MHSPAPRVGARGFGFPFWLAGRSVRAAAGEGGLLGQQQDGQGDDADEAAGQDGVVVDAESEGPTRLLGQRDSSGELDHGFKAGGCHLAAQVPARTAELPGPACHDIGECA